MLSLMDATLVHKALRQIGVFAEWNLDVLGHRLIPEQRAILEQDAPPYLQAHQIIAIKGREILAQDFDADPRQVAADR